MADIATSRQANDVSPGVAAGARRAQCSSAAEFRARRRLDEAFSAFTSNLLDVADMTPVMRETILAARRQFLESQDGIKRAWDAAMAARESEQ